MKKIKFILYTLSVFVVLQLAPSCSESDFDKYPPDHFIESGFFVDQNSVNQMLLNGYYTLRSVYAYYYYMADLTADDTYNSKFNNSTDHITMNEANVTASNSAISNFWTNSYAVISRAHITMEQLELLTNVPAEVKTQYLNEAKYLRALMYFNLVRVFGDVPLILKDIKEAMELFEYGREDQAKVIAQVISDLKDAQALPAQYEKNADIGRATNVAAKALLAEVYLYQKDYSSARTLLAELVASDHQRGLLDRYTDIFDADNPNNKEIVFAVQYARGYDASWKMNNPIVNGSFPNEDMTILVGSGILNRGTGTFLITRDLFRQFEADDLRKGTILEMNGTRRDYIFTTKYYDFGMTSKVDSGCDWIVHRWADVLLMYAEALAKTGAAAEALPLLQAVRTRAGLETDAALAGDADAMIAAIEQERRLELFGEGHRWFDLVRTDRVTEVMNAHFNNPDLDNDERGSGCVMEGYKLIFPIPINQVLLNPEKIKQNDRY